MKLAWRFEFNFRSSSNRFLKRLECSATKQFGEYVIRNKQRTKKSFLSWNKMSAKPHDYLDLLCLSILFWSGVYQWQLASSLKQVETGGRATQASSNCWLLLTPFPTSWLKLWIPASSVVGAVHNPSAKCRISTGAEATPPPHKLKNILHKTCLYKGYYKNMFKNVWYPQPPVMQPFPQTQWGPC